MRKPGSGACRRTRRPEGDDIILIFARRGNLIEHHCACAPIPLRFGPQIRSLFIEYGIVLKVVEMSTALHQAEALQIGRAPSELQSLMSLSYAVFCLTKKKVH